MANTYVDYTGDGNQTSFAYTFAVLSGQHENHIIVGIDDSTTTGGKFEVVDSADYTIDTSAGTITFDTAPESGARIRIRRDSDASTLLVDFKNGTVLPERDLDLSYLHNLFLNEEIEEGSGKNTLVKNEDGNYDGDSVKLVNLADPENAQDAVTKGYADGRYVDEAGDTMTGNLDMGTNEVTSSSAPSSNNSLTNKSYVDGEVATEAAARITGDSQQVTKAGDSMSGDLTMNSPAKVVQAAAPTTANDLTNKTYVDGVVAAEASNRASGDQTLTNSKVSKSGDTMTGALTLPGADPISDNHATRKRYVDQQIAVAVSSGTPGGPIDTANISDAAITTDKIADDAVTADKLDHTGVTADSYTNADITVDENGRITAASNGSSGAGATDLGVTHNEESVTVTSSTGDDITLNAATPSVGSTPGTAGVMTDGDKEKLNGIAANAEVNPTNTDGLTEGTTNLYNQDHTGDVTGSTTLTIESNAVTSAKIANNAVTSAKISDTDANFSINSSGQVRIGTTATPSSLLTVDGTVEILKDRQSGTPEGGQIVLRAQDATQERFVIDNYGVGDSIYRIYTTDDAGTQAGVDRFNIKASNGYVGISQNNPQYMLDIQGDVNITGDFRKNGSVFGGVSKYASSWFNDTTGLTNGGTYSFTHGLGTDEAQVQIWMATSNAGANIKLVPFDTDAVDLRGASITALSTTSVTVQLTDGGWTHLNSNGTRTVGNWGTDYTHIKVVVIG